MLRNVVKVGGGPSHRRDLTAIRPTGPALDNDPFHHLLKTDPSLGQRHLTGEERRESGLPR